MTPELVIQLTREALTTALVLSAPLLIVGFVMGIAVSFIQILTSIQDSAFSAVPRLVAFLGAFVLAMPWMLQKMTVYMTGVLGNLDRYGH
ncbi:MAG TPA: flagellar biosynthetic protein FliQ [Bryobacteraceae bacterium]|nr:flagellar biosynthetic protein FliQ [Bryobacteraceae bacterium]